MLWALVMMAIGPKAVKRYPMPLSSHQRWLVSLSAMLEECVPGHTDTLLYPHRRLNATLSRRILANSWGITTPARLYAIETELFSQGHRLSMESALGHQPLAWDMARYVHLVRHGFAAGYLEEQAAWQMLWPIVPTVSRMYRDWQAFADDFLTGRELWRHTLRDPTGAVPQETMVQAVSKLLDPANTESPWNLTPWESIYRQDRP